MLVRDEVVLGSSMINSCCHMLFHCLKWLDSSMTRTSPPWVFVPRWIIILSPLGSMPHNPNNIATWYYYDCCAMITYVWASNPIFLLILCENWMPQIPCFFWFCVKIEYDSTYHCIIQACAVVCTEAAVSISISSTTYNIVSGYHSIASNFT